MTSPPRFTWQDAWVFLALSTYDTTPKPIDLAKIIEAGDILNRAIFTLKELQAGFSKLAEYGLITVEHDQIKISEDARKIIHKVQQSKGGLFSMVDNALKRLNSPRLKLPSPIESKQSTFDFLTEENLDIACKEYHKQFASHMKKRKHPK